MNKMIWYIFIGVLVLLVILTIYVYYTIKDNIKEAFQVIDNMDTSNINLDSLLQLASNTNINDVSGIQVDLSNVNVSSVVNQLQSVVSNAPTADSRPITDKQRRCDTLRNSLTSNQQTMEQRGNVGDLMGMQQTTKIMETIQKQLSDLGC